jgi:hypothetical protein
VADLRKDYPPEVARGLLRSLQDVKDDETRQIPVTAPLINFGDGPDLLMDDGQEPLKIFPLLDSSPAALPPTLPPGRFPARTAGAPPRAVPQTLYEMEPPIQVPRTPRARPSQPKLPSPVEEPISKPRRNPAPLDIYSPLPVGATQLSSVEQEPETNSGAWLPAFLVGIVAAAGLALAFYSLVYPLFVRG